MRQLVVRFALVAVSLLAMPGAAHAQKAFTNDDVVHLAKLGLGDDVVIAKIRQAAEVNFRLEVDDLAKLKESGVSARVIAAMLDRATDKTPAAQEGGAVGKGGGALDQYGLATRGSVSEQDIKLVMDDKEIRLVPIRGDITITGVRPVVFTYLDYPGLHARIRTRTTRPSVLIRSQYDPTNYFFIGKLDANEKENNRSLKIDRKGGAFNESTRVVPASHWYAEYEASEAKPGVWRITPKRDLVPGEYGIVATGGLLYDFGVD